MAPRRGNQVVTLAVVVVALIAVWWTQRGAPADAPTPAAPPMATPSPRASPSPSPSPSPRVAPTATPPRAAPTATPPIAAPTPATPAALALGSIADPEERAAVIAVATAIDRGGPFAYRKDGAVFENREGRLPRRARGYWREYTVPTPTEDDRGARRLVAGDRRELYYTRDHYRAFVAVRAAAP